MARSKPPLFQVLPVHFGAVTTLSGTEIYCDMDDLEILNNPTGINLAEFTWDDVRSLGNPEIKIYAKSSTNKDALQEDVIQGVQEAIQEDAGDGIVITIESPTNCLPACGHSPWSAPNLERHGSSQMSSAAWLEIPDFAFRICCRMFIWNF